MFPATVRANSEIVMATLAHSRNRCFQGVIGLPQLTILYSKNSLFQGAAHINMNFNIIIQGVLDVRRNDEG